MIDFLKIYTKDDAIIEKLKGDSRIQKSTLLYQGDEVEHTKKETHEYKGVQFVYQKDSLNILFKPHYYFNGGVHNANDFTVNNCIDVLQEFANTFFDDADLVKLKIVNLEYGINAISPINVKDLIALARYHQRNEFVNDNKLRYSKKSFTVNGYKIIKFYAKSEQYPMYAINDTFRFEVKSKRSRYIKTLGIDNFKDLLNRETYTAFKGRLLYEFNDVLILYSQLDNNLSEREKTRLNQFLNSNHWYKLLQGDKHRNTFINHKKEFSKLLDKTGYNIHDEVYKIINEKIDFLLKDEVKTDVKNVRFHHLNNKTNVHIHRPYHISKNVHIHLYIKGETAHNCICPITGLKLTIINQGYRYAKSPTLRKLKQDNPQLYFILKYKFFKNSKGLPKDCKDEIHHLAKQIKNSYNRIYYLNQPIRKFKTKNVPIYQGRLFSQF